MNREEVIKYCEDQWTIAGKPVSFHEAYIMGVKNCFNHVEFLKSCETICDFEEERKKQIDELKCRFEEELERYKQENNDIRAYNHQLEHENDVLRAKIQMVELIFGGRS